MSLSARDRQALTRIEEGLTSSDPRFAARLSAFARLSDDGGMPARERIRSRRHPFLTGRWWLRWTGGAGIIWLAIVLAMLTVAIVLTRSSPGSGCAQWQGLSCVQRSAPTAPPASGGHTGHAGHGAGIPAGHGAGIPAGHGAGIPAGHGAGIPLGA